MVNFVSILLKKSYRQKKETTLFTLEKTFNYIRFSFLEKIAQLISILMLILKGFSIVMNVFLFYNFYYLGVVSIIMYLLTLKNEIFNSEIKKGCVFNIDRIIATPVSTNYFFYSFFKIFDPLDLIGIVVYLLLALTSFINNANLNNLFFLILVIAIFFFSILKIRRFFDILKWIIFSIVSFFLLEIINNINWNSINNVDQIYVILVKKAKYLFAANKQFLGIIIISYLFLSFSFYFLSKKKFGNRDSHSYSESNAIDFVSIKNFNREYNIFPISLGLFIGMIPIYLSNFLLIIELSPILSSIVICTQTKLFIQEFSPFFFFFRTTKEKGVLDIKFKTILLICLNKLKIIMYNHSLYLSMLLIFCFYNYIKSNDYSLAILHFISYIVAIFIPLSEFKLLSVPYVVAFNRNNLLLDVKFETFYVFLSFVLILVIFGAYAINLVFNLYMILLVFQVFFIVSIIIRQIYIWRVLI